MIYCSLILLQSMSYKDILLDGPANVPPELLDSDEDDDEPTLTTEDTAEIPWYFLPTG